LGCTFAAECAAGPGVNPQLPERLAAYLKRPRLSIPLSGEFCHFKEFLLEHKN